MTSRTVLITGAAQRIGASLVRDLHAHNMDVVIHYFQSEAAAITLAAELNNVRTGSASIVQGDLQDFDSYHDIVQQACAFKERLDVLVNNASSFFPTPVGQVNLEQWQNLVGVNMQAPFFLSQQAAPYLARNRGCIINLTDIHAVRPLEDHALYCATKAGQDMLTRALAQELGPAVRVNGLALGAVLWPEDMTPEKQEEILAKTVLKRTADPVEIGKAVRFLVNDAAYMTGQILTLDGGRTLYS